MRVAAVQLGIVACASCTGPREAPPPAATHRPLAADPADFDGAISGQKFRIHIPDATLIDASRSSYTWRVGTGELSLQDSGAIAEETAVLVARSPRTIMRGGNGLVVITELVTTAGGRVFTCLHRQPVSADALAKQAAERGVAACTSLRIGDS